MSPDPRPGVLVAVVGPSGAGKDTLMSRAALDPGLDSRVRFARRVVTRAAQAGSEDHDSCDPEAFAHAEAQGAFSLVWAAHGLRYGLPQSLRGDLAAGRTVVANLSRRSLAEAATAFGTLEIVEVTANPDVLLARLAARGRETEASIRDRLRRTVPIDATAAAGYLRIDNSGDVETATGAFVLHLNRLSGAR